ncbi:cardiolipin synthase ClsB [Paracidovorax valerianellae]|uniref:Cardiolipin synthase B n=1 Tax=Paracidovorax valerianellae TaxID=187868 RepID=A0A1G7CL34_9BURK|nr:cardiolipin synthase ClsB [Paracidovorax valerianellae]MDA8443825.1 cardiolipin synthase ClsB [Paracidovorax valerianellae]SDE39376.1 putative cardiolipin synthase [Paracidovorax valerianellae]
MREHRRSSRWVPGNQFTLLENGEAFFPRVFEAISQARREVILETFILFDDKIGQGLHAALLQAARNGAEVHVLVDGFGSPDLPEDFVGELVNAGVRFRIFDPGSRLFGQRLNVLRRMHRKIVVVDGEIGFIGGINYSADHVADFGPEAKQDYSVEVRGPVVAHMLRFARDAVMPPKARRRRQDADSTAELPRAGTADAIFVTRDNHHHTNDIERHYRVALRAARERVVIANAYFFPGYRFIREMRRAARRGVDVRLILQGQPDMPIVRTAASMLYDHLLRGGVRIYEYCDRPLHGKVALVDNEWSTVGSSNLDPLSLSLNLEANVVIRDKDFNATLYERLDHLMQHSCRQVEATPSSRWDGLRLLRSYFLFHLMRWFPSWAGWLPRHEPKISLVGAQDPASPSPDANHRPSAT